MDSAITLMLDSTFQSDKGGMLAAFKDSLNGKIIAPGHTTINFGEGKWNKEDEESLRKILHNLQVRKEGSIYSFRLPKDIHIGHGIFIPEFIVKINEPGFN